MTLTPTPPDDRLERFTRLWMDNHRAVAAYIRMSVHDLHHAEDVLQEVATDASRNFDRYEAGRPFVAWLIGIARQRIADHYRRTQRKPLAIDSEVADALAQAHADLAEEMDDRLIALRKCMDRLPERHRRLIDQRYDRGRSLDEIAAAIGSNAKAVNALFTRIRKALQQCVEQRMEAER